MVTTLCAPAVNPPALQDLRASVSVHTLRVGQILYYRLELCTLASNCFYHMKSHTGNVEISMFIDRILCEESTFLSTALKNLVSSHSWKIDLSHIDEFPEVDVAMKSLDDFRLENSDVSEHEDFLKYWDSEY